MARAIHSKKHYCHQFERLDGAIHSKTITNFSNSSSQSGEKTQDIIREVKIISRPG